MDTLKLLKRSPDVALLLIANELYGLSLTPDNSRVIAIEPGAGNQTVAVIEAHYDGDDQANDPSVADPYTGQLRVPFDRLALSDIFGDPIDIPLRTPTNTNSVLDVLSIKSKIVFDDNDFALQRLEGTTVVLAAKAESRRWVGSLTLRLSE